MANPDIITISGNPFDVYGLKADADIYFSGKLNRGSWADAASTDKDRALVSSARLLDQQNWLGTPVDVTTPQANQWPRTEIVDRFGKADTFPDDVVNAYHELAQALLDDPALADTGNQDDNTKRVKAGEVEAEFFTPTFNTARFPNQVDELLKPYLDGAGLGVGAFSSGTDGISSFCPPDQYERDRGFA